MAEVRAIFPEKKMIQTSIGKAEYDYLVLAAGTTSNFFGNEHIEMLCWQTLNGQSPAPQNVSDRSCLMLS